MALITFKNINFKYIHVRQKFALQIFMSKTVFSTFSAAQKIETNSLTFVAHYNG